jgi:hypothetical protein
MEGMDMVKRAGRLAGMVLLATVFAGCFGINSVITLKNDGSGTIDLEYRISKELLAMGTLDGNEAYPALPVGEADFKRSLSRIDGLSLTGFSKKDSGDDLLYRVKLRFAKIDALVMFLETQGQTASLSREGGRTRLALVFSPGLGDGENVTEGDELIGSDELIALLPVLFDGYEMNFALKLPADCAVRTVDAKGQTIPQPVTGSLRAEKNSVEFSAPMSGLLGSPEPVAIEVSW